MLNRILFFLLVTVISVPVCRGEEPDSLSLDTTLCYHRSVPPIQSIYLNETSVWSGLPTLNLIVPASIKSFFMSDFRSFHQVSVSEALEVGSGDFSRCLGYVGQPCFVSVRGSDPRSVLFVKDGVPVNDEMTGSFDASSLSKVHLRGIDVMYDCGSSTYGPNSSGGVVNLVSKTFQGGPPYSRVGVYGGSRDYTSTELEFGRDFGRSWSAYASWAYTKEDGFKENADFDTKDFDGDLSYSFGGMKAGASVWWRDGRAGVPGDTLGENLALRQEDRLLMGTGYLRGNTFDARFYYKDLWHQEGDSLDNPTGVRTTEGFGAQIRKALVFGKTSVVVGGSARGRSVEAGDSLSCDVKDGGVTALLSLEPLPLVYLSPSISYWYDDTYGSEISPRLSASMVYDLGLVFFASLGRGFNAPGIAELFSPTHGNDGLKPEHALCYLAGMRYEGEKLSISIQGFGSETNDIIDSESDSSGLPVNTGHSAGIRGLDVGLKSRVSVLLGGMSLRLVQSEHSGTGEEVPCTPAATASAYAGYNGLFRKGQLGVNLVCEAEYIGERSTRAGLDLPDHYLLNACGELRIVDVRFSYRIENLLDQACESVSGYPLPGRTFVYGLDWEFWN